VAEEKSMSIQGESRFSLATGLCQGLRYGRGQGGLIVHVVQLTLAGCYLTSCMGLHCSARLIRTARTVMSREGSPFWPLWAPQGPLQHRALVLIPGWDA
jgi:hypothetical protein